MEIGSPTIKQSLGQGRESKQKQKPRKWKGGAIEADLIIIRWIFNHSLIKTSDKRMAPLLIHQQWARKTKQKELKVEDSWWWTESKVFFRNNPTRKRERETGRETERGCDAGNKRQIPSGWWRWVYIAEEEEEKRRVWEADRRVGWSTRSTGLQWWRRRLRDLD